MKKEIKNYEAPEVRVLKTVVEKGFAASDVQQVSPSPWESGNSNGFDVFE